MNPRLKRLAVPGLRWTLGVVILLESVQLAFSSSASHHFSRTGLPPWVRFVLAGGEILAALLFLLPAATRVGGYLLLFIIAVAAIIHLLHGEPDVGPLLVYAMAVIVCMAQSDGKPTSAAHDSG